jgi:hypothetical protein
METVEIPKGISTVPTAPTTTVKTGAVTNSPITGKRRSLQKMA